MKHVSRRDFLRTTGAALGVGAAGLYGARSAHSANDKVTMAIIGVGGMGNGHLGWFAGMPDVEIAAICDVDEGRRNAALQRLTEMRPESTAKGYGDFREIMDRDDINAVSCATPDHWHAPIAMAAFEAGKDVYGEKPVSHTLVEADAMKKLRRKHDRVFQLGTQIHEGENYHRVVELVRSGAIGDIDAVHVWKTGGSPKLEIQPDQDPPAGLDWDMWLGPAPYHAYNPNRCPFSFRYFWDYSGGHFADFWCHISDIVFWALEDLGEPISVSARGAVDETGAAETPAWIDIDYKFDGLDYYWTTDPPKIEGVPEWGIGAAFIGDKGVIACDYGSRVVVINGEVTDDLPDVPSDLPRSPGHQRHFVDCVKSREQPESNLDYVHRMTLPMYLGNISFRLGRELEWDADDHEFKGDDEATEMLHVPYREPWKLPR